MKQPTVYQFKPWSRLSGDAQKVGETLEELRQVNGTLSPALVVSAAEDESSVLHTYFEWQDGPAAQRYRETQAAHLLRSLISVKARGVTLTAPARSFVSIRRARADSEDPANAGSYTSLSEAVRVVDYREQLMQDALRDLDAYRVKYTLLSDLTGWGASINNARNELQRLLDAAREQKEAAIA